MSWCVVRHAFYVHGAVLMWACTCPRHSSLLLETKALCRAQKAWGFCAGKGSEVACCSDLTDWVQILLGLLSHLPAVDVHVWVTSHQCLPLFVWHQAAK